MLITIPDPGAGNEISYTFEAIESPCVVMAVNFRAVTSIVVVARHISLVMDVAGVMAYRVASSVTLAALSDRLVTFGVGSPELSVGNVLSSPLPAGGLFVPRGGRLRTVTVGLLGGDVFSGVTLWFEPVAGWIQ